MRAVAIPVRLRQLYNRTNVLIKDCLLPKPPNDQNSSESTSSSTKNKQGYSGYVPAHRPGPGPLGFPLPGESAAAHLARLDRMAREYKERNVPKKADAVLRSLFGQPAE